MNYYTDPASYDKVYYPSLWKPIFLFTVFLAGPLIGSIGAAYQGSLPFYWAFIVGSFYSAALAVSFYFYWV